MTPPPRRDRWASRRSDVPFARRIDVEGGVRVAKPGHASGPEAAVLVALTEMMTTTGIGQRARTYARAGQVVEVRIAGGVASAAVQGSDAEPYRVSLTRTGPDPRDVEATCSCPYGSSPVEWCKHAAALGYVVAHLVDADPALALAWSGADPDDEPRGEREPAPAAGHVVPTEVSAEAARLRALLLGPAPSPDAGAQWRSAGEVVPLPR